MSEWMGIDDPRMQRRVDATIVVSSTHDRTPQRPKGHLLIYTLYLIEGRIIIQLFGSGFKELPAVLGCELVAELGVAFKKSGTELEHESSHTFEHWRERYWENLEKTFTSEALNVIHDHRS